MEDPCTKAPAAIIILSLYPAMSPYSGVTKESNVDKIAGNLQKKVDRASILARLREKKAQTEQIEVANRTEKRDDRER